MLPREVRNPTPTNPGVQPKEDQRSPRHHQTDAESLTGLSHAVQGKGDPHHHEAGQGQDVHAEKNVLGEHCPCPLR